jgi:hypothetical protein
LVKGVVFDRILSIGVVGDATKHMESDPTSLKEGLLVTIRSWENFAVHHLGLTAGLTEMFLSTLFRGCKWWNEELTQRKLQERYHIWRMLSASHIQAPHGSTATDDPRPFSQAMENEAEESDEGKRKIANIPHGQYSKGSKQEHSSPYSNEGLSTSEIHKLERTLFTMTYGCQMFITVNGKLGMVAHNCHAKADDEVCVLGGGVTPFILRKEGLAYRLMGPCYVHDYMYGEASVDLKSGKLKIQEITIV